MKNRNFDGVKNQTGYSILYVTLVVSVVLLISILPTLQNTNSRIRVTAQVRQVLRGYAVMEAFGVTLQRAYDLSHLQSTCPAGTTALTSPPRPFCLPNSPICAKVEGKQYCLEDTTIARVEPHQLFLEGGLRQENVAWYDRLVPVLSLPSIFDLFNNEAQAQRVSHMPNLPPTGSTNNSLTGVSCPGSAICKSCNGSSMDCLTLTVCPRGKGLCAGMGEQWTQTYGFQIN